MNKFTLLSLLMIWVVPGIAQKKMLTHEDYDGWKQITGTAISNDGNYVLYTIDPNRGDGTLYIDDIERNTTLDYARGANARFTFDSRFAVFLVKSPLDSVRQAKFDKKKEEELPKDSLFVVKLPENQVYAHERVQSYKLPKEGTEWVAFLLEKPLPKKDTVEEESEKDQVQAVKADEKKEKPEGNELMILHLPTQDTFRYERVTEYVFSENGERILFSTVAEDTIPNAGVFAFHTSDRQLTPLDTGKVTYKNLAVDKVGEQAAFVASEDSLKAEERFYNLYYWNEGRDNIQLMADTVTEALPDGWMVSEHAALTFSDAGDKLFFGTAPRPEKYAYEQDTTILDEERVKLDVWTWKDPYVQPMQKVRREEELKRSYQAVCYPASGKILQLADATLPELHFDQDKKLDVAIGTSNVSYRQEVSWDFPFREDVWLVNLQTGSRTLIAEGVGTASGGSGSPGISPGGKFVAWYLPSDSSWYAYDVANGHTVNLTQNIETAFYNEENDSPHVPGSYGKAGWVEEDEALLVYDRYDLWKVDPTGNTPPENLTDKYGRENKLQFRYIRLDPDIDYIPKKEVMLLRAFDEESKQSGFFREDVQRKKAPEQVILDDYAFSGVKKAKNTDDIIFRKESFQEYPDAWVTGLDFQNSQKLSEANPQQDEYLWGSVELVAWTDMDGKQLQGMLYKPENFDPSQKYPMMVYFYERNSDNLHRHIPVVPHRSIINFTYYTSRGYLVFVPDIHYTIGYPGESALKAVVSGTLEMVEKGFVDKENMALQGHSWGGYQIAYMVTRTHLFKAAEAGAPVANMISAYGGVRWGTGMSRMFQYERTQSRIGGSLWEYPLRYIENSPIFFADKIQTPLLILHNDHDSAVPWEQGIELFMALRRLGKPAWMINYNDEPHWPTKYQNVKDWNIRMEQYFDHYLKGEPAPVWMEEGIPALIKGKDLGYSSSEDGY